MSLFLLNIHHAVLAVFILILSCFLYLIGRVVHSADADGVMRYVCCLTINRLVYPYNVMC